MAYSNLNAQGDNVISIGSQAWNIADGYTKIKILRLIIQLDLDEEIAFFGKKDDLDQIDVREIPVRRIEGFNKFIFHLKQLIGNCKFAIEKGLDEKVIVIYEERISFVESVSNGIANYYINDVTKEEEIRINEEHFNKCFNSLKDIKDQLNFPINRAGLIFRQGESLDIDSIMRSIEEGE